MSHYFAIGASVLSLALPVLQKKEGSSSSTTNKTLSKSEHANSSFSLGMVVGMGLSSFLIIEMKRNRIKERIRYNFQTFLSKYIITSSNDEGESEGDENNENTPTITVSPTSNDIFHKPIASKDLQGQSLGESSILQTLINPMTSTTKALTSTLCTVQITLKPKTCMNPTKSKGVEMYYVLSGTGTFLTPTTTTSKETSDSGDESSSDDEDEKGHQMIAGDIVAINPWTIRSMSNTGREDLIFLRISDDSGTSEDDIVIENTKRKKFKLPVRKFFTKLFQKMSKGEIVSPLSSTSAENTATDIDSEK